jgi:ubiquinone/menaquinone biosynthesis C-methylase UbiE
LPFPDAGFDFVLSWNVIHHGTLGDLGRRLGEIWRVLRPAGLLQATVLSTRDANYGIGRAIAPDTFVIDQVSEKATRIAIAMPRRSSVCLPALICSFSASNCRSGDPARTTGTSSPNVAAESGLRGEAPSGGW